MNLVRFLRNWASEFKSLILSKISKEYSNVDGLIESKLEDLKLENMPIVLDYIKSHMDSTIVVKHCTRIVDENQIRREGLITGSGRGSVADARLRKLLSNIGLKTDSIERVMSKVYRIWERRVEQITESVHFQVMNDDSMEYLDVCFAENLGGEVLNWAIESCGSELFRKEPYKRLWIWGTPCIIKFRCKTSEIYEPSRAKIIAEIVKYNVCKKIFDYSYDLSFTGMTIGSVHPENIMDITEIDGFMEMQKKCDKFKDYYYDHDRFCI